MKRFSEQLHKKSQTVKLKKSEQADLRERLVSYMEYHPLPAAMKAEVVSNTKKTTRPAILTDAFSQYAIPYQMLFKFGSVAAVFVLLVVPFMAERTVPGDTLYAVKVNVNEEVRSSLTWGSYEKVEWETTRLNRRIAEARLLADEGLLTDEVEAEVAAAVKEHSDNAKREIEVLRASDADEAAIATIAFDSSLEVQAQALQQSMEADSEVEIALQSGNLISDVIDESLEKTLSEENPAVPAYDKLMARVEMNTTRVRELRDSLERAVDAQALADVTRRVEDIDRAIVDAVALADAPETELEARTALVDVLTRTQKLIVFMTDLEVREQVAIESVVPVVLTDDEMSVERSTRETALTAAITQLRLVVSTIEDQDLTEKVADALARLENAQPELAAIETYTQFITQSDNVLALATDALRLAGADATAQQSEAELPVETASTTATSAEGVAETASTTPEVPEEEVNEDSVVEPPVATSTETELFDSI